MLNDTDEMRNLVFEYADLLDTGDLKGLSAIFSHATINRDSDDPWHGAHIRDGWTGRSPPNLACPERPDAQGNQASRHQRGRR